MQKIFRRLTAMALLLLLLCLMTTTALAKPHLWSSWGDQSYFDDDTRPWGSGRLGSSWGDRSYFDDDDRIPWGSGHFGSSWSDPSYFDDDTRPWGSGRLGSSWGDRSYFDDDTIPWGISPLGQGQVSSSLGGTNTIENTRIDRVGEVQMWLNKNYSARLYVDGVYGKLTKKAVITALQIELGFTGKDANGIADAKMLSALPTMRTGTNGEFVKLLQCLLVCNGYRDAFVDGSYGNGTCLAVQSYQAESALSIDGICGKDTWTALLT